MPFCLMENLILTTFRKWRKILHCSWSNQSFLFSGYSCNFHEQDCITCFICIPFKLRQRKIEISCMDLLICLLENLVLKVKVKQVNDRPYNQTLEHKTTLILKLTKINHVIYGALTKTERLAMYIDLTALASV